MKPLVFCVPNTSPTTSAIKAVLAMLRWSGDKKIGGKIKHNRVLENSAGGGQAEIYNG